MCLCSRCIEHSTDAKVALKRSCFMGRAARRGTSANLIDRSGRQPGDYTDGLRNGATCNPRSRLYRVNNQMADHRFFDNTEQT